MDTETDFTPEESALLDGDIGVNDGLIEDQNDTDSAFDEFDELDDGEDGRLSSKDRNKPPHGFVNHGAFHEEREERKKAQAEAAEANAKLGRLQERFRNIQNQYYMQPAVNNETPNIPDPETDFIGYVQWMGGELQKHHQQEQNIARERAQQQQAVEEVQAIEEYFMTSMAAIRPLTPDFDDAADFLYQKRASELRALAAINPEFNDDNAILGQIGEELRDTILMAMQNGANPAEAIYAYAKCSGYTPKNGANYNNGNIAHLEAQQSAAKTLTASNGSAIADPVSLDAIDRMSEAEFARWISVPANERAFNLLMQGD